MQIQTKNGVGLIVVEYASFMPRLTPMIFIPLVAEAQSKASCLASKFLKPILLDLSDGCRAAKQKINICIMSCEDLVKPKTYIYSFDSPRVKKYLFCLYLTAYFETLTLPIVRT